MTKTKYATPEVIELLGASDWNLMQSMIADVVPHLIVDLARDQFEANLSADQARLLMRDWARRVYLNDILKRDQEDL